MNSTLLHCLFEFRNEIVNQNIMINVSILHFLLLFMIYRSF